MKKKLIFLDIDGTLTEPGMNVPPDSALKAIRLSREAGHKVFLCTGRNLGMLAPLLKYGFDGVVASAGGYVALGDKVIYDCPMEKEQFERALEVFGRNGVFRTIECRDHTYTDMELVEYLKKQDVTGANSELIRWRQSLVKELNLLPMEDYDGQPVYKLVFMSPSKDALREPKETLSGEFILCVQNEDQCGIINGELINRKFDKGRGVLHVCRELGMEAEDTVGFGDSMNDLEMIETVGVGVAMANGARQLQERADLICPSVTEDGLYRGFEALGLLG